MKLKYNGIYNLIQNNWKDIPFTQEKFVFAKDVSAKGRFQGFLARFRTSWVLNSRTDKGTCGRCITVKRYVLHLILLSEVFSLEDISVCFVNAHWSQVVTSIF